ncbi:hypothetical protein AB0N88_20530 [Streptomyces sp. NPDC093516]|uniref:hypothetical protein n=1 Tax=Streptomyces sp. NPDC093516 TaxID=3155304 RepID=UPI0034400524
MDTQSVWLVEITFRSPPGRRVQHCYLIAGSADAVSARRSALRWAHTPGERAQRDGLDLDAATVEARAVVRDVLGVWNLAGAPVR